MVRSNASVPSDADTPKYAVPPPLPPVAALILIVVLDLVAPVEFLPKGVSLAAGIPLLVLGLGFWGWGMASLSRHRESPNPFKPTGRLLTSGALRASRNPIYAGGTVWPIRLSAAPRYCDGGGSRRRAWAPRAQPSVGGRELSRDEVR
jgi:protein-S-isoprenylcysteine O-methyltransferase Ste14